MKKAFTAVILVVNIILSGIVITNWHRLKFGGIPSISFKRVAVKRSDMIPSNVNQITDFKKCAGDGLPNWKKLNGVWMDLHPVYKDVHVSGMLSRGKVWESTKFKFLSQNIPSSKTFVDIGANIGVFTLQALQKGYNVVAVEALNTSIKRLCSSIVRNNFTNIKLYHNAVWDDINGTLGFHSPYENIGGTQVLASSRGQQINKILMDSVVSDLDNYVMKIDIEAAECKALRSTKFWKHPPVALSMEWGNLKRDRNLCPQTLYDELVKNITRVYKTNLRDWNEWDAPNLRIKNKNI